MVRKELPQSSHDDAERGVAVSTSPTALENIRIAQSYKGLRGTEIMAVLGTVPMLFLIAFRVATALRAAENTLPISAVLVGYLWYIVFILFEAGFQMSPTLAALRDASRKESTAEMIERVKDTATSRIEVQMTCLKVLRHTVGERELDDTIPCKAVWTGSTKIPIGSTTDTSCLPEDTPSIPAVWVEFDCRVDLANDRSRQDFERHIKAFVEKNKHRGDGYELVKQFVVAGVNDDIPSIWYSNPKGRRPWAASQVAFWVFTAFGLTLPYRIVCRRGLPRRRFEVIKKMSSVWDRSSGVSYASTSSE